MPRVDSKLTSWPTPKAFTIDVVLAGMRLGLTVQSSMLLCAHIALSTGWGKACHNWNLAGMKVTPRQEATLPYAELRGFEWRNGKNVYAVMKWRVFDSLDAGLAAVLALLHAPRYKSALALLLAGDPEYFAEVGRNGWYTADPATTSAGMRARLSQIQTFVKDGAASMLDILPVLGTLCILIGAVA